MIIKNLSHIAKETYHYTKTHLLNSSESAVKLAQLSNKDKHFKFAEKMLSAKNKNLNPSSRNYEAKLAKNHRLRSHFFALSFKRSPQCIQNNSQLTRVFTKAIIDIKNLSKTNGSAAQQNPNQQFVMQLQTIMGNKIAMQ